MALRLLARKVNSNNIKYALAEDAVGVFSVYKLCENYCRHSKGGIAKTWRAVEKFTDLALAQKLFDRRTK